MGAHVTRHADAGELIPFTRRFKTVRIVERAVFHVAGWNPNGNGVLLLVLLPPHDSAQDEIPDEVEFRVFGVVAFPAGEAGKFVVDADVQPFKGIALGEEAHGIRSGVSVGFILFDEEITDSLAFEFDGFFHRTMGLEWEEEDDGDLLRLPLTDEDREEEDDELPPRGP